MRLATAGSASGTATRMRLNTAPEKPPITAHKGTAIHAVPMSSAAAVVPK